MKYKVGDRVVIDADQKTEVIDECVKYCGKIAMITDVDWYGYKLDIDGGYWTWREYQFDKKLSDKLKRKNKTTNEEWDGFTFRTKSNKVILSDKYTIVILPDGRKGIAKCHPDDEFDKQRGFEIALAKALLKEVR